MGIWAAIVAGLFLYTGAMFLTNNIIIGTSVAIQVVQNVIPVVIGVCAVAVVYKVFK